MWHKVSEEEKEEIRKNSKRIMDEFGAKLEKIKIDESHFESGEGMRDEGDGWETMNEFRDTMFCNAVESDGDFIVAERGGWK